jgi:BCD family chlorophyll transporter-like MFS transporter
MAIQQKSNPTFSFWRAARLSSFQIGSAMGDILVTSIWNRVMISNFGIPAAPVSLLIALRYLVAPLSLWAGFLSDTKPLFGLRRTPYIWLGRILMIISLPFLGLSLMLLGVNQNAVLGWTVATLSSLLYGIGTLISGSPFLALVRDSAPPEKQGLAISTVQTSLIVFFALFGIIFSLWMAVYEEPIFWQMVVATMLLGGFFWFFAIVGVEKRNSQQADDLMEAAQQSSFSETLRKIWRDRRTRGFFFFLSLATMSAWMQDAILEPFGADVFAMPAGRTTRFNSYWQVATVIFLVGGMYLWRKRPPERQSKVASGGLLVMAAGMMLLAIVSLTGQVSLTEMSLFIYGAGFGLYTFGGLSLMAVMSSDQEAGAYLGLWTVSILVFKGVGTFLGGSLRDLFFLSIGLPAGLSYGLIFAVSAIGLLGAVIILAQVDVLGFARDVGRVISRTEAQIAGAD